MSKNNFNTINCETSRRINIINEKKILYLPKIKKQYFPLQHSIKILNNNKENSNYLKYKLNHPIFLTITKDEEEKNYLAQNNKSGDQTIHNILNDKIKISYKNSPKEHKKKELKSSVILNKYMNEAILYRKSFFQKKKIDVGKLLELPFSPRNNDILNYLYENKRSRDSNFNDNAKQVKKLRKFKTQDKSIELDSNYMNNNFTPNIKYRNCNFRYKFNKNKDKINEVTSVLKNLEDRTKATFNKFKDETDHIFHSMYYNNELDDIF
jgi:hypothetical protein